MKSGWGRGGGERERIWRGKEKESLFPPPLFSTDNVGKPIYE